VLEIKPDASEDEIKKAYKTLSKKWHPDKNPDNVDEATKKFQSIAEAYAILSDPEKKQRYDQFGSMDDNGMPGGFDPRDLFEQMMGGSMGGFHFGGRARQQQEDCVVEQMMTLEDIYNEKNITIKYNHKVSCERCNGTGSKTGKSQQCNGCNGSGHKTRIIRQGPMIQQVMMPCDECNGSGEKSTRENQCDVCHGLKYTMQNATFDLKLNQNMTTSKIAVENKGHITKQGRSRLIIGLREQPHPTFKRQGRDLHIDLKLRFYQSIYGFSKMITHLDGKNILLKYDNILSQPTTTMRIRNMGMGGDMYVHINTTMPRIDRLDENENNILRKLLTKAHLAEFQKEQNITKNADKMEHVIMEEVAPQSEQTQGNDEQEGFNGVQCQHQ
jgi:DnaJ family protein A protein 2